ncbi:MAG: molybdopterin-dependent oxidoreductase, partial [Akkermansiaceae bacterium]|nr:molybdopterin-dependent oxidoreductase [Akkermansiaceae bacterium]
ACPKGWEALTVLDSPDRATTPLLRDTNGKLQPVGWDTALRTFVDRMRAVQSAHGPHSVAFLSTGQIVTEEMALLGAVAKFGMGIRHGDANTRQCMATAVVAYKQAFGFDAPPYTYDDLEQSDTIFLVGDQSFGTFAGVMYVERSDPGIFNRLLGRSHAVQPFAG